MQGVDGNDDGRGHASAGKNSDGPVKDCPCEGHDTDEQECESGQREGTTCTMTAQEKTLQGLNVGLRVVVVWTRFRTRVDFLPAERVNYFDIDVRRG